MEGGGCAWWWLQTGSEEICQWRRGGLLAWTALDAQWLHFRGHGYPDLGAHDSQATMGWVQRLEEQT